MVLQVGGGKDEEKMEFPENFITSSSEKPMPVVYQRPDTDPPSYCEVKSGKKRRFKGCTTGYIFSVCLNIALLLIAAILLYKMIHYRNKVEELQEDEYEVEPSFVDEENDLLDVKIPIREAMIQWMTKDYDDDGYKWYASVHCKWFIRKIRPFA